MTKRLLVAFPGPVVKSLIWDRRDIVVFDQSGWWLHDGPHSQRRLADTLAFVPTWSPEIDLHRVLDTIRSWGPTWTRWIAHADQYELLYREAANYVLHVMEALSQLDVTAAVFHTGIAHHLDSSLLQIACAERHVAQVFLYENPVVTRLQPLVQRKSIEDRVPLNAPVSDFDASDTITRFHANSMAGRKPATSLRDAPVTGLYQSAMFGALDALYIRARQRAGDMVRRFRVEATPSSSFFDQFPPLGVTEFLRLIGNQKRGLAYHDARIHPGDPLRAVKQEGRFAVLIAAHYQPEATSFPEGGQMHNHYDIMVKLRSIGYQAPVVYKEHIGSYLYYSRLIHQTRVGMNRSESYYRRLEELGCLFMDPRKTFRLDDEANQWVIPLTITGTMAIERSLAGLKTLVSGKPWYRRMPGTIDLPSMQTLDGLAYTPQRPTNQPSEDAHAFLDQALSRHTLTNAPGVGSGRPLNDSASLNAFAAEFNRLVEYLLTPI